MLSAIALALFSAVSNAAKAGDLIPNQFIVHVPVVNTAAALETSYEPAALANIISVYSARYRALGIRVLRGFKAESKDVLLVNASATAVRALSL